MKLGYTTVLHEPRINLGLTTNEYCLADTIYRLSTNPKARIKGWCDARKDTLGLMIGVSKQTVITIIKRLEEKGLVIKSEDGRLLRSGDIWIDAVIDFDFTKSKETLPNTVKKLYQKQGKDSLPNNNSLFNNNNNTKKKDIYFIKKDPYDLIKYKDFKDYWLDFIEVKKKKKGVISCRVMTLQYEKLFKLANGDKDKCIEILSNSVNSGWADIYAIKEEKRQQNYNNKPEVTASKISM